MSTPLCRTAWRSTARCRPRMVDQLWIAMDGPRLVARPPAHRIRFVTKFGLLALICLSAGCGSAPARSGPASASTTVAAAPTPTVATTPLAIATPPATPAPLVAVVVVESLSPVVPLKKLAPYRASLTYIRCTIERIESGTYDATQKLMAVAWGNYERERLWVADLQPGQRLKLTLVPFPPNPDLDKRWKDMRAYTDYSLDPQWVQIFQVPDGAAWQVRQASPATPEVER